MKNYLLSILSICLLFMFTSCDLISSSDSDNTKVANIAGKVQGPDQSTPINNATVYVGEPISEDSNNKMKIASEGLVKTEHCEEPSVEYEAYTCTSADGSFEFEIEISADQNEVELQIFKGAFSVTQTVDVDSEGTTETGDISMESDEINAAVVTGNYDRMQDILAKYGYGQIVEDESSGRYGKLELGTEEFDLYDGNLSLGSDYPEMGALFEDGDGDGEPDINNYDIVFINCGASEQYTASKANGHLSHGQFVKTHSPNLSKAQISDIQNFINNGGMLYATDWAYDYAEQAFPSYIDFLGSDGTPIDEAESQSSAQQGQGGITVDADILDSDLQDWLATSEVTCGAEDCLNSDQTVFIEDFLSSWAVIDEINEDAGTKTWIEGPVEWSGDSGVKPLTVSFKTGADGDDNRGRVVYSSYHTIESEFSPEFRPQERILQYLVE